MLDFVNMCHLATKPWACLGTTLEKSDVPLPRGNVSLSKMKTTPMTYWSDAWEPDGDGNHLMKIELQVVPSYQIQLQAIQSAKRIQTLASEDPQESSICTKNLI